jgi:prevent-host-death family protein
VKSERTAVYWLRDELGVLLYVGVAEDPARRWGQHAADKPWWSDVRTRTVEWFDTKAEAHAAEMASVKRDCPRYNQRGALAAEIDVATVHRVGLMDAKKRLHDLVDAAADGEPCVIYRNGTPLAVLTAYTPPGASSS